MVWVGSLLTADWRKGRVVLSITTATDEVVYVVRLEVPAADGTRILKAHARDLTIFHDY